MPLSIQLLYTGRTRAFAQGLENALQLGRVGRALPRVGYLARGVEEDVEGVRRDDHLLPLLYHCDLGLGNLAQRDLVLFHLDR